MNEIQRHYDLLLQSGNDPVCDPKPLIDYMDLWDGEVFLNGLGALETKSVLEIGVGTGRLAVRVAPRCRRFVGIDIAPETLERARVHLAAVDHAELLCADFMTHIFSESFDVIYSSLTFMHIENKSAAIEKAYSLLREGGRFVLSIDKNQALVIDAGISRIEIFPDDPEQTETHLLSTGFRAIKRCETEFAHIFISEK